ncbi:PDDEXK nuclease domain-containing protein [Microbacterium sp.]|uniref:PDDEXK nuclease domain-containing protein n=1 Tax=Microbacterium sp. TaxID=51671 RepID=UPI003A91C695
MLRDLIGRQGFERNEIANSQDLNGAVAPLDSRRDPYLLEFLGLSDAYVEHDLEEAIVRDLQTFLLEVGTGWSFIARQKRMLVGGDDFFLDCSDSRAIPISGRLAA